ncbi:MAG: hypothetical protein UHY90_07445 [Treponema sp.]|nr:hypothetical protein [Spirochaetia bacterium]MEE1182074.1 hypothetical protein [Treponema sp.]
MATCMERDVLLELAASYSADYWIKYHSLKITDRQKQLLKLHNKIMCTEYKDIDYEETLKELKALRVE